MDWRPSPACRPSSSAPVSPGRPCIHSRLVKLASFAWGVYAAEGVSIGVDLYRRGPW